MARRQRRLTPFNLSFLDIMACGFGAVTLLFLILKHGSVDTEIPASAEVDLLQEEIMLARENQVQARNSLAESDQQLARLEGLSRRVLADIEQTRQELSVQSDPEDEIEKLRAQVKALEQETAELKESSQGEDLRTFIGDGDRQYLTGLKLGGRRILILLDSSASMLAEDIVNVIRRRNMDDNTRRNAPKWQRATRTVEWLLARFPPQSQFQIVAFDTRARSVHPGDTGWLNSDDAATVDAAIQGMQQVVPGGGTSLVNAFRSLGTLSPAPDNVFLITDGLPTQGTTPPRGSTVSARERVQLFQQAVEALPRVPLNVILFPMEGDPGAAGLYWQLGLASGGSFLSPSTDWP